MPQIMVIDSPQSTVTGASAPMSHEKRADFWSAEFADLHAPHWVPTGGCDAMDFPALRNAPALRIIYGEQRRGV